MMLPIRAVLPSNASPVRNGTHASRILREGRSFISDFNDDYNTTDYDQPVYPVPQLSGHSWAGHELFPQHEHQQQSVLQANYPPLHQPVETWDGNAVGSQLDHSHVNQERDRRVIDIYKILRKRAWSIEAYVKYRNPTSKKSTKSNDRAVWPDNLEEAFWQALVKYPPVGRRKLWHEDKLKGRNELVAFHIHMLTGTERPRKKISSHIQTLKPFFLGIDPMIMKYLSGSGEASSRSNEQSSYMNGRRASNYPVPPRVQGQRNPAVDATKLEMLKGDLSLFEPTSFQMFVQQKFVHQDRIERLHTYCQSVEQSTWPDLETKEWQRLSEDFPFVANMHEKTPLDCNILIGDASLAFPASSFKDDNGNALPGVELGISFSCGSRHLHPTSKVQCQSSFYRNGELEHSSICDAQFSLSPNEQTVETPIKFGSSFWAKTLAQLAARMKEPTEGSGERKDDVPRTLQSITAVQEVLLFQESPLSSPPRRILIILWRFRLSSSSKGKASWQRVLLPGPTSLLENAIPSTSQYTEPPHLEEVSAEHDFNSHIVPDRVKPWQSQSAYHTLQSPFDYDSSSTGSALSSATWPTSISDIHISAPSSTHANATKEIITRDNAFDFNGGNINVTYDVMNFPNLDSSALNFDSSNPEFVADPGLESYPQSWDNGYAHSYHVQHMLDTTEGDYETASLHNGNPAHSMSHSQSQSQSDPQSSFSIPTRVFYTPNTDNNQHYDSHEQQAFGGDSQLNTRNGNHVGESHLS